MKKEELQERVDEMLSRGIPTLEYYFKLYPELQTERESLHESILQTILGRKTHSKGKRIFMVGGAPANGPETRMEDVRALKTNGHWVRMDYVTLDTPLSLQIAGSRFRRTGRKISDDLIREYNRNLATLVPQLIDNQVFDELHLWDTNIAAEPRLVLTQKNREIKIINPTLYENFKRKAYD